jgi:hypothetical protein
MSKEYEFSMRWKEELVCDTPWATFVVEITMGSFHIYFPDEEKWKKTVIPEMADRWGEVTRALNDWAKAQNIPVSCVSDAWLEFIKFK